MIKSNSPKKLWDDCLELEMEIRSCTANNVFELKGDACLQKETENHSSSQQEIPQDDTKIWDQGAQNCGGSPVFGQGKWE